jgi:hypothetical protein
MLFKLTHLNLVRFTSDYKDKLGALLNEQLNLISKFNDVSYNIFTIPLDTEWLD